MTASRGLPDGAVPTGTTRPRYLRALEHPARSGSSRLVDVPFGPVLAVVVLYAFGSFVSYHSFGADVGLAFFPPAGITVAALILTERRSWPFLIVAVFLTELTVDLLQGLGVTSSFGYAVANSVQPLVGVVVFLHLNPQRVSLDQRRGKLSYLLGACGAGALAGALIGGTVATDQRPGTDWITNVAQWWAGDGVAILAIGVSIVLASTTTLSRRQHVELALGVVITAAFSLLALNSLIAPATVILPILTVLAFRLGPVGAAVGGTAFALVANYSTNAGKGYFAQLDVSPDGRLALLQLFIAVLVIVAWSIGVEVTERVRAVVAVTQLEYQRDQATAALQAIHRAVGPIDPHDSAPFSIGTCYRQSAVGGLVGGDWFDAFRISDGRMMFAVGDVVGHGIDAMEDMAHLRLACRAFMSEGHDPARILTELSTYTVAATRGGFATMILCIHDPSSRTLVVASAGHPPPVRRGKNGRAEFVDVRPGAPLGAIDQPHYEPAVLRLAAGDVLVMYTDGVVERRGHSLDEGLGQLIHALESVPVGAAPTTVAGQIVDRCFPTVPAEDDRCVLVIEIDR